MISVRAAAPRRLQSEAHHRYGDLFEIRRELGQENRLAFRDGLAETDPLIVVLNWFGGSLCAPDRVVEVSGRLLRPRSKSRNHRALDLSHRPATRRSILSVAAHP